MNDNDAREKIETAIAKLERARTEIILVMAELSSGNDTQKIESAMIIIGDLQPVINRTRNLL